MTFSRKKKSATRDAFSEALRQRIRALRAAHGMSQAELAKRMRCSRAIWAKYETRTLLPLDLVIPFCELMSCDPHYLLTGRGTVQQVEEKPPVNLTDYREESRNGW